MKASESSQPLANDAGSGIRPGQIIFCTLVEGDYYYGVAALANSLQACGYKGRMICGYRGRLPAWAEIPLHSAYAVELRFVPLATPIHLANYKPQFMQQVWNEHGADAEGIFYLDPDICVTAPMRFLAEWLQAGIAVCEDINSPLHINHPRRVGWRQFYKEHGIELRPSTAAYVNSGCVGLTRPHRDFLARWERLQERMGQIIGGLSHTKLDGGTSDRMRDPYFFFNAPDQDALNATMEASPDLPFSILGREAMAFKPGLSSLPHAVGSAKPWRRNYIFEALKGRPPSMADKVFWKYANGPYKAWTPMAARWRALGLLAAAAVGRIWRTS